MKKSKLNFFLNGYNWATSHLDSALKLKEIFAQMPIMVLNNINTCLKMDTNALFGTIVVYQVNNIHLKNSLRVFSYNSP